MASEIKALTTVERETLLQDAQLPIIIPTDHALAMKADLGIPWNKLRILRRLETQIYCQYLNKAHLHQNCRWFKSLNVSIASEGKQRELVKDILGDSLQLVAEKGAFTFTVDKKEVIREVPFVYLPNFIAAVADIVAQHDRHVAWLK